MSIIEVDGPGAGRLAQRLCASDLDVPVGKVVYTLWLTRSAGIKRDLIVARMDHDRYWMFVGEGTLPQDLAWVERQARGGDDVAITALSDQYAALGVWGPRARSAMAAIADGWPADFEGAWVASGPGRAWVMGVSYVGEPGFEIHMPVDQAEAWFDLVWEAARAEGMVLAGSRAMNSLRIEKGYVLWGADVHTEYDPMQAGLGWVVDPGKEFVGADAFRARAKARPKRRLRTLIVETTDLLGYEPVLRDDEPVSYITSAGLSPSLGASVGMAYLSTSIALADPGLTVMVEGKRRPARLARPPLVRPSAASSNVVG